MAGRRHTNLNDALNTYRPMDFTKVMDWPHAGPRAILEILSGIRGAGRELATYHDLWMSSNGFHPDHNIAWEHKILLLVLRHLVTYDQIDVTNVSGSELLARLIVTLERAVRANPKAPSFAGLHRMIENGLDDTGGFATRDYTAYYTKVAADEAHVFKQHRLLREEQDNAAKHKPREADTGDGGGGRAKLPPKAKPEAKK